MARDLANGDQVSQLLSGADHWGAYKDQRHDLFITSNTTAGYLTGPTAATAGYLTAGCVLPSLP